MRSRSLLATALFAATAAGGTALALGGAASVDGPDRSHRTEPSPVGMTADAVADPSTGEGTTPTSPGAEPDTTDVVVVPGSRTEVPDPGPDRPLGELDPHVVPPDLDLTAFPTPPGTPTSTGLSGADSFSAGWGCAVQCITKGVAHARGFGAQMVVETSVEADLFLSLVADTTGDGDWDFSRWEYGDGATTHQEWSLDDLDPGQTYHVMVVATDSQAAGPTPTASSPRSPGATCS